MVFVRSTCVDSGREDGKGSKQNLRALLEEFPSLFYPSPITVLSDPTDPGTLIETARLSSSPTALPCSLAFIPLPVPSPLRREKSNSKQTVGKERVADLAADSDQSNFLQTLVATFKYASQTARQVLDDGAKQV